MKVLLDECVHQSVKRLLPNHTVRTVADMGWRGVKNGKLMSLAATEFDVLLTVDKNLRYQQNRSLPLPVIVILSKSLRLDDIAIFLDEFEKLVGSPLENRVHEIGRIT